MKESDLYEILLQYNHIFKDTDEVYHRLAGAFGLSNCAFWILYLLRETSREYTQAGICEVLQLPRQTVNSALKKLQSLGYIRMESDGKNQKNKLLRLTSEGIHFASETVDLVFAAEQNTLNQFSAQERKTFIEINQKYCQGMRREAEKIIQKLPGKPSSQK